MLAGLASPFPKSNYPRGDGKKHLPVYRHIMLLSRYCQPADFKGITPGLVQHRKKNQAPDIPNSDDTCSA